MPHAAPAGRALPRALADAQTGLRPEPLAGRVGRLAIGVLAIAALGFAVAQADRLPGPAGELIRANVDADRDTTALFYTEVDGWDEWGRRAEQ